MVTGFFDCNEAIALPVEIAMVSKENKAITVTATAVITAVAVTVIALFSLLTIAISTGKAMASLQSKNPVTIEVTGHQWWWEVRYPDSISSNIVVTANEIHIPVGTPVVLNSTSQDVT